MTEKLDEELKQVQYNLKFTKFKGTVGEKLKQAFEKRERDILNIKKYL
jgi:hypothetical protein